MRESFPNWLIEASHPILDEDAPIDALLPPSPTYHGHRPTIGRTGDLATASTVYRHHQSHRLRLPTFSPPSLSSATTSRVVVTAPYVTTNEEGHERGEITSHLLPVTDHRSHHCLPRCLHPRSLPSPPSFSPSLPSLTPPPSSPSLPWLSNSCSGAPMLPCHHHHCRSRSCHRSRLSPVAKHWDYRRQEREADRGPSSIAVHGCL